MSDLIDRQQAIDVADVYMKRLCRYIGTSDDTREYAFARGLLVGIKMDIGELPSAQPKRGKWISADAIFGGEPFYCSECGENTRDTVMGKPRWNFCPNCGADMREVTT